MIPIGPALLGIKEIGDLLRTRIARSMFSFVTNLAPLGSGSPDKILSKGMGSGIFGEKVRRKVSLMHIRVRQS